MSKKKTKGLIFISNVQKALEHEWFCDYVSKSEFDIEFVLFNSNDSELYNYIITSGFRCKNYTLRSKFFIPFYVLYFYLILLYKRYDFIHCHLFEASLIGLISSKYAGIKKRIHTRHHADFHHTYFPNAVKYDLLANRMSTHIIAVSSVVEKILVEREHVPANKISVIEHAIDLKMFDKNEINTNRIDQLREKYAIKKNSKIVGVVSRFTEWKGIQFIIPAFGKYIEFYPESVLVLANANGDYKDSIMLMLNALPENSYRLIEFENDSPALFQMFDIFVHVPVSPNVEAFGQVYIEAMASGIPSIFTKSGIGTKILNDGFNCLICNYLDEVSILKALMQLTNNEELKLNVIKNALSTVHSNFNIGQKNQRILNIYRR